MKRLLISTALALIAGSAHAQLFIPGSTFTVNSHGTDSPAPINGTATLTFGVLQSFGPTLGAPVLNLTIFTEPGTGAPGAEWLVFKYSTLNGELLSPTQLDWELTEDGLQANQPLNIDQAFVQFSVNGLVAGFNSSPFAGFSPVAATPPDLTVLHGPGLGSPFSPAPVGGPGPLGPLGSGLSPFGQLDGNLAGGVTADTITGYTEALEFSPAHQSAIPEARTWVMMLIGFGVLALGSVRHVSKRELGV